MPELYDLEHDFFLIYPRYEAVYGEEKFMRDAEHMYFMLFDARVYALGGLFEETISKRARYLKGVKMDSNERRACRAVLTPEQLAYKERAIDKKISDHMDQMHDQAQNQMANTLLERREKRRKEREAREKMKQAQTN